MANKKNVSSIKGLMVRSVEESRGRAGYRFTSTPQFIDVQRDELDDNTVQEILEDRFLMAVEVDKAPKGASAATRRTQDGGEWQPGNLSIGNATLETATATMVEQAKRGEQPELHPSAPGGETVSTSMSPDAVAENIKRLEQQQLPEGGKNAARSTPAPRKRGRPAKAKVQPTAKPSSGSGDAKGSAGEGTSPVNAE
jgi:hypothetical protein